MDQVIRFKTSLFNISAEREHPFNPIFGESFLKWLKEKHLKDLQISEIDAEDWGWYTLTSYKGQKFLIGASFTVDEGEWTVLVEKSRSLKDQLFGRKKTETDDECFLLIKSLIDAEPGFYGVEIN